MCTYPTLPLFTHFVYPARMARGDKRSSDKRPEKGGLVRIVGYFYPEEAEALDAAAYEKRISRAEVLRRALRAYLDLRL